MRKCSQLVFAIVLMTANLALITSAETQSVGVSFTASGFQDAIYSYEPPARRVTGSFSFDFDFDQPAGDFSLTPTSIDLIIAEGTSFETDFSKKVIGVGVQWDGNAFIRIRFWAGGPAFYAGGDDFILTLFPESGGQNSMRYSLLSALSYYRSSNISFKVCNNSMDTDSDGANDCEDQCPYDPNKTQPGICGCSVADTDSDGDGTLDCEETDNDNDGVADEEEQGPNGDDSNYDGNNDGIADSSQEYVASFHTYDNQSYLTLESPVGTSISNCKAADNPSATDSPSGIEFTNGFFEFTITGVGNSGETTVILYFPGGTSFNTYYKYGPTPSDDVDHWYEFLDDGQTGAEINGDVITLHLVDGIRGDDDLTATGIVTDIGGPAVSLNPGGGAGGSGGSGGCFFDIAADSLEW